MGLFRSSGMKQKTTSLEREKLDRYQETQRKWDTDLRQRGLGDVIEARDELSQLHQSSFA